VRSQGSRAKTIHFSRALLAVALLFPQGCVRIATYDPWDRPSLLSDSPSQFFPKGMTAKRIRVAIAVRKASVRVEAPEAFVLSGSPIEGTPMPGEGAVRHREILLTSDKLPRSKAYLAPLGEGEIIVDGRSYRGSLEVLGDLKATVTVINDLPLEEYVMGVLAGEIPQGWPLESLKAQALAARTFAILKQSEARRRGAPYDLENTHLYQMYHGTEKVTQPARQAVIETAGEILIHKDSPIQAFFHSNCGGKTSRAGNVWSKDQPYLRSVDCPFCQGGPHFQWKRDVPLGEVARQARAAGIPLAEVLEMKVLERDESGRVVLLSLKDENWSEHRMKGSAFRMAMGTDVIKSTRFDLGLRDGKAYFSGRGWGHGVGLCQEGAWGMALKGSKASEIIRRYYPGVTIERMGGE